MPISARLVSCDSGAEYWLANIFDDPFLYKGPFTIYLNETRTMTWDASRIYLCFKHVLKVAKESKEDQFSAKNESVRRKLEFQMTPYIRSQGYIVHIHSTESPFLTETA